jgi:YD repeat-containing protein
VTDGSDPRFGMQAPVLKNATITMPSALQATVSGGRLITQMTGNTVTGMADSIIVNGNVFKGSYDGNQRLITSTTAEGRKVFARFDAKDRITKDSLPGFAPTTYTYDTLGRITQASQGGRSVTFQYDSRSRVSAVTDPLGRTTSFAYDSVGRVLTQILPDGRTIGFSYDANGNVTSVSPPGRPAHAFDYTAIDLTKHYIPPYAGDSMRSTAYEYNLDGDVTRIIRPDSQMIEIEYGNGGCGCGSLSGLPKSITFDRGQLKFSYDTTRGTLKTIVAPGGDTLSYTFDGSLLTKEVWSGNVTGNVQYTYDNNFRVTQQRVNSTDSVTFSYDKDGLLKKAGALSIGRSSQSGLITADTVGNITSSYSYDSLGNLSFMSYHNGGSLLYEVSYTRDSLSRISSLTETIQGETKTMSYTYDPVGRLSTVTRNDTLVSHYYYDANGNRDSAWTIAGGMVRGTYDVQDRLLTYGNASYFYTKNGELSEKVDGVDTTKYTYDQFGNLTKVVFPNGEVIEYIIDGQNRRVGKKVNGTLVQRYLYGGQLYPVAELDSAGNMVSKFVGGYMMKGDSRDCFKVS